MILLDPKEVAFTNDIFSTDNKHYITIFVQGLVQEEPHLLEPHKCEQLEWFF